MIYTMKDGWEKAKLFSQYSTFTHTHVEHMQRLVTAKNINNPLRVLRKKCHCVLCVSYCQKYSNHLIFLLIQRTQPKFGSTKFVKLFEKGTTRSNCYAVLFGNYSISLLIVMLSILGSYYDPLTKRKERTRC